jgi:hypothetical protein
MPGSEEVLPIVTSGDPVLQRGEARIRENRQESGPDSYHGRNRPDENRRIEGLTPVFLKLHR